MQSYEGTDIEEVFPDIQSDTVDITNLEVAPDVEQAMDIFETELPKLKNGYVNALERDRTDEKADVKFRFGDQNPGLNSSDMFQNAMDYLISAETLEVEMAAFEKNAANKGAKFPKKDDLQAYNTRLERQFGPTDTQSGVALEKMRSAVKDAISGGMGPGAMKHFLRDVYTE